MLARKGADKVATNSRSHPASHEAPPATPRPTWPAGAGAADGIGQSHRHRQPSHRQPPSQQLSSAHRQQQQGADVDLEALRILSARPGSARYHGRKMTMSTGTTSMQQEQEQQRQQQQQQHQQQQQQQPPRRQQQQQQLPESQQSARAPANQSSSQRLTRGSAGGHALRNQSQVFGGTPTAARSPLDSAVMAANGDARRARAPSSWRAAPTGYGRTFVLPPSRRSLRSQYRYCRLFS